jgi:hypothetical protein
MENAADILMLQAPISLEKRSSRDCLSHFSAEAGKVYYFRTRMTGGGRSGQMFLDLDPIDSDLGKLLIASYSIEHFAAKK